MRAQPSRWSRSSRRISSRHGSGASGQASNAIATRTAEQVASSRLVTASAGDTSPARQRSKSWYRASLTAVPDPFSVMAKSDCAREMLEGKLPPYARSTVDVQWGQRLAANGIFRRQKGHSFSVGTGGAASSRARIR